MSGAAARTGKVKEIVKKKLINDKKATQGLKQVNHKEGSHEKKY